MGKVEYVIKPLGYVKNPLEKEIVWFGDSEKNFDFRFSTFDFENMTSICQKVKKRDGVCNGST